jgi:hypothetical protein
LSTPYRPGTPYASSKLRQEARCVTTHCRVSSGTGPCCPIREGSSTATRLATLDPASLLGRAPVLPRVPWLRIPPPRSGGLRCHNVSRGFGSRLPAREGSNAATYPTASDPASPLRRALTPPCVLWLSARREKEVFGCNG